MHDMAIELNPLSWLLSGVKVKRHETEVSRKLLCFFGLLILVEIKEDVPKKRLFKFVLPVAEDVGTAERPKENEDRREPIPRHYPTSHQE